MPQYNLFPSQARTATPTAATVNVPRGVRALRLVIDVTAIVSTPSVTFQIDVLDNASGKFVNLLTSAAIATVSTTVLNVAVGITAAANLAASLPLGDSVRISPIHGNANSITYSCALHLLR